MIRCTIANPTPGNVDVVETIQATQLNDVFFDKNLHRPYTHPFQPTGRVNPVFGPGGPRALQFAARLTF